MDLSVKILLLLWLCVCLYTSMIVAITNTTVSTTNTTVSTNTTASTNTTTLSTKNSTTTLLPITTAANNTMNATSPTTLPATTNVSTTTTTTTTTTPTTTTTTTLKPCKKMRFRVRNFQDNPEVKTIVGSSFTFDCSVDFKGGLEPNITWFKEDLPLQETSYRTFPNTGMEKAFKIELNNLSLADSGKYKCSANNLCSKPISTTFKLIVLSNTRHRPIIQTLEPMDPDIIVGGDINFDCITDRTKENPTPFIKWIRHRMTNYTNPEYRNITDLNKTTSTPITTPAPAVQSTIADRSIKVSRSGNFSYIDNGILNEVTDLKMEQTHTSRLTIKHAIEEDTATYICLIINEKGVDRKATKLTVNPIPPLSKEELEKNYVNKYGESHKLPISLPVLFTLPIFLLVIMIIGCVWWYENDKRKTKEVNEKNNEQSANEVVVVIEKKPSKLIIPDIFIQPNSTDDLSMCYPSSSEESLQHSRPPTSCSKGSNQNLLNDTEDDNAKLLDNETTDQHTDDWEHVQA